MTSNQEPKPKKETDQKKVGEWMGIGIALGLMFGLLFDNIGMGMMFGLIIGLIIGSTLQAKEQEGQTPTEQTD
ncbi:hypothetical protein GC175_16430 [bacterium]|nr:hypothetical protein [bacterium]